MLMQANVLEASRLQKLHVGGPPWYKSTAQKGEDHSKRLGMQGNHREVNVIVQCQTTSQSEKAPTSHFHNFQKPGVITGTLPSENRTHAQKFQIIELQSRFLAAAISGNQEKMFAELATCQIGGEDAGPGTDSHRTYYVSSWCTSAGRLSTLARLFVPVAENYADTL
ncbi:hypothetical protein TcasGA2_TC014001 [Tribolium castaneum]|uniref:Uncharacterized protein n=1 Tax=Tribolium castaneum TaxID=7070 RepID=D6WJ48_TRICA|nr:hypothetical protein TcasGA2_TC014001 [Tribolium castaneum]